MHIEFQKMVEADHIPSEKTFAHWLGTAIKHIPEKIPAAQNEIVIRIISSEESATLNETFRHKKGPTNVLAFKDQPLAGLTADTLGDLAICADIVKQEAEVQSKSIEAHWAHMVIHGFLHLLGYDHIEPQDADRMEAQEIVILQSLGFKDPYQSHEL